jgi:hypothetical protein
MSAGATTTATNVRNAPRPANTHERICFITDLLAGENTALIMGSWQLFNKNLGQREERANDLSGQAY